MVAIFLPLIPDIWHPRNKPACKGPQGQRFSKKRRVKTYGLGQYTYRCTVYKNGIFFGNTTTANKHAFWKYAKIFIYIHLLVVSFISISGSVGNDGRNFAIRLPIPSGSDRDFRLENRWVNLAVPVPVLVGGLCSLHKNKVILKMQFFTIP